MADNVQVNSPSTYGAVIATDEIGGVHHQKMKVEFGDDESATQVSTTNPLPTIDSLVLAKVTQLYDLTVAQQTALNTTTLLNAPAINVRDYEFSLLVAQNRIQGHSWVLKSGKNPDVDTATVPEDIWNGGGAYAGFPLTAPETVQVLSSSASDVGVLTILYLPTSTSTAYVTGTVTLNGTTPVNASFSAYRVHSAFYTDSTGNIGDITVRWATTTSVVFLRLPIGTNQSYSAGYTIPFGTTGYVYEIFCSIQGGTSSSVDGALWIRNNGAQFRLRRNFDATGGANYRENLGGALVLPALTDIQMRITNCTANNTPVVGGYSILLITT